MYRRMLLAVAAMVAAAAPAQAETWRHARSSIALELPASLRVGQERQLRQDGTDTIVQLGSGDEPVTFYVYRAAYPSPALWFERARHALNANLAATGQAVTPRPFTLAGAAAPNGLREEIELPGQSGFRSTAIAIAAHGEWLIKVRISSRSRNRAEIARLMDEVLAGVRVQGVAVALPLTVPGACGDRARFTGRPSGATDAAGRARLQAATQRLEAQARGRGGLVAEPAAWCRAASAIPGNLISLYRRRDGSEWVALLGDAAAAISAVGAAGAGAGVYGSTTSGNQLLFLYDGIPTPEEEIARGVEQTMRIGRPGT